MLKWLRKYNKALLIFFGVFLMIAFLVPQALTELGRGGGGTVMVLDGREVSAFEAQRTEARLRSVQTLTFGQFPDRLLAGSDGSASRSVDHWIMARESARRAGFFGGASDGAQIINSAAQFAAASRYDPGLLQFAAENPQFGAQIRAQLIQEADRLAKDSLASRDLIASRTGLSVREVDEALAATEGVARMAVAYGTAPRLSGARLLALAREQLDQAEMTVLFIGVDPNVSAIADPSEAALEEHFQKYRDKRPPAAAGPLPDDASPFGYLRPQRFKLEFLQLERASIEKAIKVSPIAVEKRILAGEGGAEADPAKRRAAVATIIRGELTEEVLREATLAWKAEVLAAIQGLADQGSYKVLPGDWASRRPTIAAIAQRLVDRVRDQTGQQIPLPTVIVRDRDWIPQAEVQALPGIGASIRIFGNNMMGFTQIVSSVRELSTPTSPKSPVQLQVGVPAADPTVDSVGDHYFFTVLDARPESAPDSLAEVRAEVINDRKRADAYAALEARLAEFQIVAATQGLEGLQDYAKALGGLVTDLRAKIAVRRAGVLPRDAQVNTKAFTEAVSARMKVLDPTVGLDKAPPTDLLVGAPIPARLGLGIGRFTAFLPATIERFRQSEAALATRGAQELVDEPTGLLSRERLARRLNVEIPGIAPGTPGDSGQP